MNKEPLERIAQLIIGNPAITVKQIAKEMGYSEEKSVYYWLDKGKYYGIKQFKRAVLTGEFYHGHQRKSPDGKVADRPHSLIPNDLPVARGFTSEGQPILVSAPKHYFRSLGESVYAWIVRGNDYCPLFNPGDVLFIDPEAQVTDGDLVLMVRGTRPEFRRSYQGNLYIHPLEHGNTLRESQVPAGKVVHIIRNL